MSEKPSVEEIRARRADPVDAPSAIEMLYTEIDALRAELFAAQKKCKAAEEIIAEVIGDDQFDGLEDGIVAAIYFLRGDRDELDAQLASEREAKEQAERERNEWKARALSHYRVIDQFVSSVRAELAASAISSPSRAPSTEEPERESPDRRGAKGHWPDVGARAMTSAEYGESPSMSPSLESQTKEH